MSQTLYLSPISLLVQLFSSVGIVLNGGAVWTYTAGTTTPATTYTDATGTTVNANPILLSSAGRLVAASGAPVAVWTPTGTTLKMMVQDANSNFVCSLDNIPAINDPYSLLASLANPLTGSGADLIANGMRSYDVFATLRAANVPNLTGSQTLVVAVEGATTVGDTNGGMFYWSATSLANDDGANVIKPTAILPLAAGRYLRLNFPV